MAKIIREYHEIQYDKNIVKEAISNNKPIILNALLQKAEQKNQNGRVYPRKILEREVENYKKLISENRATGQLDHTDESIVELKHVSHVMRSIDWSGNDVVRKT